MDHKINAALGREWQMTTIQFDFNMSERFGITYVDQDGREKRPFMVHRALLGSLERFFGVLIEHYGGAIPLWLAPVQMMIVPVAEAFNDYGARVMAELRSRGFRVELDGSDSRMNAKIRNAQNRKIPYMLVVGQKEMDENAVSLRLRTGEQPGAMKLSDFISFADGKVERRELI